MESAENPEDSKLPNSAAENLLRNLLQRRRHYEGNCRYIAARRNGQYKDIPINHLVLLAFYTTPLLLENFQDIDALIKTISDQYKSDLFSDWQKYCKALDSKQQAVATFEGAIYFASESIPKSTEREVWTSSCLNHLPLLRQLNGIDESDRKSRKRKREARPIHDQEGATGKAGPEDANLSVVPRQVEGSETNIAMMAEVDKLESTLGDYLFKGINATDMRKREKDEGRMTFTDTVRLHLAYQEGEDFKLEVWLCSSIGKAISQAISQAKMGSVEDLRNMLGDYLFGAMKASNRGKEEEGKGMLDCTVAIDVSFPNGDDSSDCKVEVMLNFGIGIDVYANIYPRVG